MEIQRHRRISAVTVLVVVNSLIFILGRTGESQPWENIVSTLSWGGLMQGRVWELITYQFLHESVMHLVFNMAALWYAGRALEDALGIPRFLALYFLSGVVGGLVQVVFNPPWYQVLGASASVCGVLAGFSAMYPEVIVTALIFFVLPLKMRAKWMGIGIVALSLAFIVTGLLPGIGHAAHLAGAVTGALMVWLYRRRRTPLRVEPVQP